MAQREREETSQENEVVATIDGMLPQAWIDYLQDRLRPEPTHLPPRPYLTDELMQRKYVGNGRRLSIGQYIAAMSIMTKDHVLLSELIERGLCPRAKFVIENAFEKLVSLYDLVFSSQNSKWLFLDDHDRVRLLTILSSCGTPPVADTKISFNEFAGYTYLQCSVLEGLPKTTRWLLRQGFSADFPMITNANAWESDTQVRVGAVSAEFANKKPFDCIPILNVSSTIRSLLKKVLIPYIDLNEIDLRCHTEESILALSVTAHNLFKTPMVSRQMKRYVLHIEWFETLLTECHQLPWNVLTRIANYMINGTLLHAPLPNVNFDSPLKKMIWTVVQLQGHVSDKHGAVLVMDSSNTFKVVPLTSIIDDYYAFRMMLRTYKPIALEINQAVRHMFPVHPTEDNPPTFSLERLTQLVEALMLKLLSEFDDKQVLREVVQLLTQLISQHDKETLTLLTAEDKLFVEVLSNYVGHKKNDLLDNLSKGRYLARKSAMSSALFFHNPKVSPAPHPSQKKYPGFFTLPKNAVADYQTIFTDFAKAVAFYYQARMTDEKYRSNEATWDIEQRVLKQCYALYEKFGNILASESGKSDDFANVTDRLAQEIAASKTLDAASIFKMLSNFVDDCACEHLLTL